jgi:hypothetical protein
MFSLCSFCLSKKNEKEPGEGNTAPSPTRLDEAVVLLLTQQEILIHLQNLLGACCLESLGLLAFFTRARYCLIYMCVKKEAAGRG